MIANGATAAWIALLAAMTSGPTRAESGDGPPPAARADGPAAGALDPAAAKRLACAALARAASVDRLGRFSYRVRHRHGPIGSRGAVEPTVGRLREGLTAPVAEKDWFGWYGSSLGWDEERFLYELTPGDVDLNYDARFWTPSGAWARHERKDRSSRNFVRLERPALWRGVELDAYGYLRLAPHAFPWGRAGFRHTMSALPPEEATWRHLGVEPFGGEACDVVDAPEREQRLWVGRESHVVRGALLYEADDEQARMDGLAGSEALRRIAGREFTPGPEFALWLADEASGDQLVALAREVGRRRRGQDPARIRPSALFLFEDYREVAPGVEIPFREARVVYGPSGGVPGKGQLRRDELRVEAADVTPALAGRIERLLPATGDAVQDRRFAAPVTYAFRPGMDDREIRERAGAEYAKLLESRDLVKRFTDPVDALVGRPAPELPASGWVGSRPASLAGRPYLLHFWATWCGPCKGDLPKLKELAAEGVAVVGMHPAGTPRAEVERAVRERGLNYPTLLGSGEDHTAPIGGYPAGMFPYCILVDGRGRVAAHGPLADLVRRFGVDGLKAASERRP